MYDTELIKNVPHAMAERSQWLCFSLVDKGGERMGKPPVSPKTGVLCAKNDESNFTTLYDAMLGCETYDLDGVGFIFTNGFIAIDLDDCFDDDGTLNPVAQDIYDHFSGAYVEYSPSGNGLHIFIRGEKPNDRTKDSSLGIEVYSGYNFVTVTGDMLADSGQDIIDAQEALDWLYDIYLPDNVLVKESEIIVDHGGKTARQWLDLGLAKDKKLSALYNETNHEGDESSCDMSLLMKLAYWLNRDVDAVTQAFLDSPWVKTKDNAHRKKLERDDYLKDSASKAVSSVIDTAANSDKIFENRAKSFLALRTSQDGERYVQLESYSDKGNAEAIAQIYGDILRYTPEWGWMYYNGSYWETDVKWRAISSAMVMGKNMLDSASDWIEPIYERLEREDISPESREGRALLAPAANLMKHAMYSQSARGINAMVSLAETLLMDKADSFDANPWILNTPEFAVDISTGERIAHSSAHRCTSCTMVSPADIDTPMFDEFLDRIFCGDKELIEFMQLEIGSSLVGKVYAENLIIANGSGSNGKSTLFGLMQSLLGDYATSIDPELLMSSHVSEQQVGFAMLQGKRFAVAQETDENHQMRSSMLKRLVSTDTVVAKKLYKDPMTFVPTHTLVLSTNHLPEIKATDPATWRRIAVVPFNATIKAEDIIADFQSILIRNEGTGILNWAVKGAAKFFDMNCVIEKKPEAVVKASTEYRQSEDWFSAFVGECLVESEDAVLSHNDLYKVYCDWARTSHEKELSSNKFSRAVKSSGWTGEAKYYDPVTQKAYRAWFGYEIRDSAKSKNTIRLVS